ncbi:FxsA family protein [Halospeciosus flavus]|uniref:FxsA family protein n=1 Tax=Halospeciosus flavus TaxID=3032283 RepID=A0ABD5Z883_9EURY|nr:FxsA family protein [Halospeciosus flavus]
MKRLFAALLLVPLVDAILLVYVATTYLTWQLTVALVVVTALLGTLFVRAEGRNTIRKIQRSLQRGEPPTDELVDGGLLIAAGAFLLTPGFVTDALGFLFVVPFTRAPIRGFLKQRYILPALDDRTGGFASGNVYTFGFPNQEDGWQQAGSGTGTDAGGFAGANGDATSPWAEPDPADDDAVDLDSDAYDIEFDDEDRDGDADGRSA